MRYIVVILIFLASCKETPQQKKARAGEDVSFNCSDFRRLSTYCFLDFLVGEDAGGVWTEVSSPGTSVSSLLVGDNPCLDTADFGCGAYQFRYVVGDDCCRDTSYVNVLKCCLTGQSTCL